MPISQSRLSQPLIDPSQNLDHADKHGSTSEAPQGLQRREKGLEARINLMTVRDHPPLQTVRQYLDIVRLCSTQSVSKISSVIHKGYTEYYLLTGFGLMSAGFLMNEAKNIVVHGQSYSDDELEECLMILGYAGTSFLAGFSLFMQLRRYYFSYWQQLSFESPIKASFLGQESLLKSLLDQPGLRSELVNKISHANAPLKGLGTIPASDALIYSVYQASFHTFAVEMVEQAKAFVDQRHDLPLSESVELSFQQVPFADESAPHLVFMKEFLKLTMAEAQAYFDLLFLASYISTGAKVKPSIRQMLECSCRNLLPLNELSQGSSLEWLAPLRLDRLVNSTQDTVALSLWANDVMRDLFVGIEGPLIPV